MVGFDSVYPKPPGLSIAGGSGALRSLIGFRKTAQRFS